MRTSTTLLAFNRVDQQADTTTMLLQAGYMGQEASGLFSLTTLGWMALRRLERQLERALEDAGAGGVMLSHLQSQQDLWAVTGRHDAYGEELMSVRLRSGHIMRLTATAEEQIVRMAHRYSQGRAASHWWYQIGTKWRDETRARAGLVRAREFRMMDSYAVHETIDGAAAQYERARDVLVAFLTGLGLEVRVVAADCGEIGGSTSEEIQVATTIDGGEWLEVGHCFMLGSTYTNAFSWTGGSGQGLQMSCHGLGTTRVLAVVLDRMRRGGTIVGGAQCAVGDAVVVAWEADARVQERAEEVYRRLRGLGLDVIWEDRFQRAGQALTASELLGARQRFVVSARQKDGTVEWTDWGGSGVAQVLGLDDALAQVAQQ